MNKDEKDIILVIVLKNIWELVTKRNLTRLTQNQEDVKEELMFDDEVKVEKVNDDFFMVKSDNIEKWSIMDKQREKTNENE